MQTHCLPLSSRYRPGPAIVISIPCKPRVRAPPVLWARCKRDRAIKVESGSTLEAQLHNMGAAPQFEFADAVLDWRQPFREGLLTKEELQHYWEHGFVVKHNVFNPEELQPAKDAVARLAVLASRDSTWRTLGSGSPLIQGPPVQNSL